MGAGHGPGLTMDTKITRVDSVALWHAVESMKDMLQGLRGLREQDPERWTQEMVDADAARLAAAKVALRKVQALVRSARKATR